MTQSQIETRVFPDGPSLIRATADVLAESARAGVRERGVFRILLSGGSTPKALFFLLAGEAYRSLPWEKFEVFWGDDRYVPGTHTESNYRSANDLLLSRVPVPPASVHPMHSGANDAGEDAERYEALLKRTFPVPDGAFPAFDFSLMGVGDDGHTASLFPRGPELAESRRWVLRSRSPIGIKERITLTVPVFNACRDVVYLVEGEGKAGVLKEILQGSAPPEELPAKLIRPSPGRLLYMLDKPAASRL